MVICICPARPSPAVNICSCYYYNRTIEGRKRSPFSVPHSNWVPTMADGDDQLGAVLGQPSLRVHPSPSRANVASSSSARPIFRVFCKGMVTDEVVGLGDGDPGMPVLAVAVCGPQGEVVLRGLKPVLGFVGGHGDNDDGQVLLEAMALVEGLHKALELGITSVKIITDHRLLHNYVRHFLSETKC